VGGGGPDAGRMLLPGSESWGVGVAACCWATAVDSCTRRQTEREMGVPEPPPDTLAKVKATVEGIDWFVEGPETTAVVGGSSSTHTSISLEPSFSCLIGPNSKFRSFFKHCIVSGFWNTVSMVSYIDMFPIFLLPLLRTNSPPGNLFWMILALLQPIRGSSSTGNPLFWLPYCCLTSSHCTKFLFCSCFLRPCAYHSHPIANDPVGSSLSPCHCSPTKPAAFSIPWQC